ncbi:ABC transporter permease [Micromonospora sp. NPDC047707]|uniref:ABC transporter permease n=1 Tax=Micromonospora sp. NPDC047707 TaxID=3154498 RepID=UPI0034518382
MSSIDSRVDTDGLADRLPPRQADRRPGKRGSFLPPRPGRGQLVVERYGLLVLLIGMIIVFASLPQSGEAFRSSTNVQALLANQAVGLVVALALLFPMAAGFFDFSVGAVTASTSVVAATSLSRFGLPLPVSVLLALVSGILVGVVLGLLVAKFGMNPFIATLGMATLLGGAIFAYTDGIQITKDIPSTLTDLGSFTWLGVPRIVLAATIIAVIVWFVMDQTPLGRRLFAIGSNANASRLTGIDVARTQLVAFTLSGLTAGVAGVLLLARQGSATSDNGMGMLFPALTAVFLSTIVIDIGRPSVLGTVIGILFVAVSVSGLTLAGSPAWVSQVFNGAALLIAVAVAGFGRGRHHQRH